MLVLWVVARCGRLASWCQPNESPGLRNGQLGNWAMGDWALGDWAAMRRDTF
jgi:hypothetical protein